MSDLNFDDKSKEELEAIAAKEAEEARIAQEKADTEAAEAAAAKTAAEEAEDANEKLRAAYQEALDAVREQSETIVLQFEIFDFRIYF